MERTAGPEAPSKKAGGDAGEVLAPPEDFLTPAPGEEELPAGFLGAVAEVILRSIFFYPGVTALGMLAVGLQEGWRFPALATAGFWAGLLLWGAALARTSTLDTVAEEASPVEDIDVGPTIFTQLFSGIFRGVSMILGEAGEGCAGALATFGIAAALFMTTLSLALLALPVLAFAWDPSWLRAVYVLAPPLPLTGLFSLVIYVGLRRRQKSRNLRLAAAQAASEQAAKKQAAAEPAALEERPDQTS